MTADTEPEGATTSLHSAEWVTCALLTLLSALVVAGWEQQLYAEQFHWAAFELSLWDHLVLWGVIASKSLILLALPLTVTGTLLTRGFSKLAWAGLAVCVIAVSITVILDARLQGLTGVGVLTYLSFLGDQNPFEMAGKVQLGSLVFNLVVVIGMGAGLTVVLARRVARYAYAKRASLGSRRALLLAWGAYAGCALLPSPLSATVSQSVVLVRLQHSLPLSLDLTFPRDGGGDANELKQLIDIDLRLRMASASPRLQDPQSVAANVELAPDDPPDVLYVVLESLRADSLQPAYMPRVSAWVEQHAQRATRHYSVANASHTSLFALLYGRSPFLYATHLRWRRPAQLCHTLKQQGYERYLVSSSHMEWQGLEVIYSDLNFDTVELDSADGWVERDQRTVARARELLAPGERDPRFVHLFLMSTHFSYTYPPDYARRPAADPSSIGFGELLDVREPSPEFVTSWLNRYRNALGFLDDQVADLLDEVDLSRTVVVFTGDHGESFYDDERWLHTGRFSDAQTTVPFAIAGPGISAGLIDQPTTHVDVSGTVLHAINGGPLTVPFEQGRDLLAPFGPAPIALVGPNQTDLALVLPGGERLHLSAPHDRLSMTTLGFLDAQGQFVPGLVPKKDRDQVFESIDALFEQLTR